MKKVKAKTKKVPKKCAGCGASIAAGQGILSGGRFYCGDSCV